MSLEPWDRRPEESDEAWRAFTAYRDQDLPRSLRRLAEDLSYADHTVVGRWSSRHDWQERTAAWDLEQDRLRREAMQRENIKAAERHARQMAGFLGAGELFVVELMRRIREDNTFLQAMPKQDLLENLARLARVAPRLLVAERLARGMTTESVETRDADAARARAARMSDEQLEAFLLGAAAGQEAAENRQLEPGTIDGDRPAGIPPDQPDDFA